MKRSPPHFLEETSSEFLLNSLANKLISNYELLITNYKTAGHPAVPAAKVRNKLVITSTLCLFYLFQAVLGETGLDTGAFLCAVVFKQPESVFSEQADGDKIAEHHESHSDVGKAPCQVEGGNSTEHDHAAHQYTVDVEHPFTVGKVAHIGFSVIIISQECC